MLMTKGHTIAINGQWPVEASKAVVVINVGLHQGIKKYIFKLHFIIISLNNEINHFSLS